jgi:hypothetical protein
MTMADDDPKTEEKTYKDWRDEALARDEQTWNALEEKLKQLKAPRPPAAKREPERPPRPPKPLDW